MIYLYTEWINLIFMKYLLSYLIAPYHIINSNIHFHFRSLKHFIYDHLYSNQYIILTKLINHHTNYHSKLYYIIPQNSLPWH